MNKTSCKVIEDLLPLYYDDVCSEESKKIIENHLAECDNCTQLLNKLRISYEVKVNVKENNKNESAMLEKMASSWKHSLVRSFIKGVLITALAAIIIGVGYFGLFQYYGFQIDKDDVVINGYMINEHQMTFAIRPTDGYYGNQLKTIVDDGGNLYISIYRTLIKDKLADGDEEIINYGFNQENKNYTAVYYGTPNDNKLLWDSNTTLPQADDTIFE